MSFSVFIFCFDLPIFIFMRNFIAIVMLLRNFVVEYKLMNGSVGTIREIVYESNNGPDNDNELPSYVIVEFPNSTIPEEGSLIPGKPATMVPIPIVIDCCHKRCCSITTVPLHVRIAITIHKSQGMTIGDGQIFEKVIVYLPEAGSRSDPGLELDACSEHLVQIALRLVIIQAH
jgi:ATP-dependent exoDNAse (exonuclease V) alpha subunit